MKRNEKILAAALGVMLVGYFAWPTIRSIFIDPVAALETELDSLQQKVADQEQQEFELLLTGRKLGEARGRGLPGSDLEAQRLYQQWLTELAIASDLSARVEPSRIQSAGGIYNSVQVTLEGTATFDELQTFLGRFRRADLLHRVFRLDIDSPAAEGDPELKFTLVVEGLNLKGSPSRSRLFPQLELTEPLAADAKELAVPAEEFAASTGDLIRIGNEFAFVAEAEKDRLQLKRGADGTTVIEHPAGTRVELLPVRKPEKDEPTIKITEIDSPFVKPRRYEPKFDGFADAKLIRGETAKMSIKVADYDRSAGEPKLELVSGPAGLDFDPATGEIAWSPSEDVPSGEHKVTLAADVPAPQKRIEQTVTITLSDPNTAPTLEPIQPTDILLGETLRVPLKAADGEDGSLDYKVEQGPDGATVDAATGEFTWTVPESFTPGEVTVTVVATDKGDPPLSAKQTFTVDVRENLKPFVYLVASIADEVKRYAWLYDRSSNRRMVLYEDESFEAAGLKGAVREIGRDFITYERNGEVWKLGLGDHLGQAEKIGGEPVAARPDDPPPIEADRPESESDAAHPAPAAASADRTPAS